MDSITDIEMKRILSGKSDWIGPEFAETLSQHPLASIKTEFPHFAHSMESPEGPERPRQRHPVFYGCYDWHSSVHSHWALIRQLRLFDDHPVAAEITESIDARVTAENVAREVDYFEANESFEKPYGWAWLLHLAAELHLWNSGQAAAWREVIEPLEQKIVSLVESEFLTQDRPFRVGTHQNSAFALHCILDYARTVSNDSLETAVVATATEFFAEDREYPVEYEPLGWDFLSPSLTEADLMRRVYDRPAFVDWVERFLPNLTAAPGRTLLDPIDTESDPDEEIALHFVGLNVSKAWSLAGIADALPGHQYAPILERSAKRHAERGLSQAFTDTYAGSHWLSSFVLYFLTRDEGGIAPE
ncbi:DUF2891 domain-containing protein [Halostagnicola kamekurae]|uniref:DUF2891 domain-containing protein n=1 Tax=Halostagnicola kamekurae TaxID=619731 RepID=A0A1I6QDZ3_9EURY|nr:DUF2891 domain-containing protein [Halostagnicola kamekurae]SFS50622.1 Protein of unknown function [Halostagnicola kamekurae]